MTGVQIWLIDAAVISRSTIINLYEGVLSVDERNRVDKTPVRMKAARAISYAMRRQILSRAFGAPPNLWSFAQDPRGRPVIIAPKLAQELSISMSRTDRVAAFACASSRALGIDIESMARAGRRLHYVSCTFSKEERDALENASGKTARALDLWTLKEAYGKALGVGIDLLPHQGHFDLSDRTIPRLVDPDRPHDRFAGWRFDLTSPRPGLRLAVAAKAGSGGHRPIRVCWIQGLELCGGLAGPEARLPRAH